MSGYVLKIIALLFFCATANAQEVKFGLPLKGVPGKDYFIDYYVDHDPSEGIIDPFCGTKTYNGHTGTDMLLRSFQTMDSGIYVYAAADGRVFEVHDGEYDRSKHWRGGGLGNHIGIIHRDTNCTYYGHLMKNSLLVKMGDSVKAGQPIGKVGSSGKSCYPHVHFEVRNKDNKIIDPFYGECNSKTTSLWISQPLYDTAVYSIENGFVPYVPNLDTLLERYLVTDTFYVNKDTTVCFWILMHGLRSGDNTHIEWFTPSGLQWFTFDYKWKLNWWYDYTWFTIKMPETKGKWKAKYYVNRKLIASHNFYVRKHKS